MTQQAWESSTKTSKVSETATIAREEKEWRELLEMATAHGKKKHDKA